MPLNNPTVDWLIENFGPVRAFNICMQLGGLRHYVPKGLENTGRSLLSRTVTEEELYAFIELWGGEIIKFPLARRIRFAADPRIERPRRLLHKLLLPGVYLVGMNLIARGQFGHRRLLPQRLQGDLRLQRRIVIVRSV